MSGRQIPARAPEAQPTEPARPNAGELAYQGYAELGIGFALGALTLRLKELSPYLAVASAYGAVAMGIIGGVRLQKVAKQQAASSQQLGSQESVCATRAPRR